MSAPNPIRDFPKYIAELRRRVSQGSLSAMCDLGMWLQEGSQDRKGRSILRSNPAYAFRLLKAAAEGGYREAAASLGYAYDVGPGDKAQQASGSPLVLPGLSERAQWGRGEPCNRLPGLRRSTGCLRLVDAGCRLGRWRRDE
jgi:TPR repeat protein